MTNVFNRLMNAYYQLLNGNVNVPVYRIDAPSTATDYVVIRPESETDLSNNANFVTSPVIITEVVTRFGSGELINDTAAHDIDGLIANLLCPTPSTHGLAQSAGLQIVSVKREGQTILGEDDGSYRYYRIITRVTHRILQN